MHVPLVLGLLSVATQGWTEQAVIQLPIYLAVGFLHLICYRQSQGKHNLSVGPWPVVIWRLHGKAPSGLDYVHETTRHRYVDP